MKKHKSVVSILLAVMMIFTMMPMMAFADYTGADKTVWNDTFTTATLDGTQYTAEQTADGEAVKASVAYSSSGVAPIWFVDVAGATVKYGGQAIPSNVSLDEYNAMLDQEVTVTVKEKKLADGTSATGNVSSWKATLKGEKIETLTGNKQMTLSVNFASTETGKVMDGSSKDKALLLGTPLSVTVNVIGTKTTPKYVYYIDGNDKKVYSENALTYDGASHTIALAPVDGYTISYEAYDATKGKWEAVNEISVKEAKTYGTYRGIFKDAKGATYGTPAEIVVKVSPATAPNFTFIKGRVSGYEYQYAASYAVKDNEEYDVYKYVELDVPTTASDAAKAAAKADEAQWLAFFKDYYEVTETPDKLKANIKDLAFAAKKGAAEDKALAEKYKALTDNYTSVVYNDKEDDAVLVVVSADDWYEIEFVNSPTSKTYKAKVLKKKAKSFKVKAVATNGEAVNYKLINAPQKIVINKTSGKITLKKGLKKGTYKITVKAYVPNSYDRGTYYATETHKITIKVKK